MMIRAADEVSGRSARGVDGEIDDTEMVRCDLLTHEDAADFAPSGSPQAGAKAGSLVTWKTDRDH